ncbi:ubiquitin-conjugating enzyme/RWD-like protein [Leucosporidium creatinivorum]|uniref:Ubiquitin-conjugating enzyme/RWD-like protein n=1 Tax=Leucosporidium creatinivorum TaxID=106004 RepID=A0A1Y2EWJ3_9BASI|nr:ubiquitin-conjugating enzyme/RWD-like protein [Leucosporidium creatinivorum]
MGSRISAKRLTKELTELKTNGPPTGCTLIQADDLECWVVSLQVLGESVYEGEEFALRFKFSSSYPIDSPEVTFVNCPERGWKAPVHPHIYTNGHICASVLGSGWSPVLNVASLLLTFQSMLASCKKKELPPDNDRYVRTAPSNPKQTRFVYHDDDV